MIFTSSFGILYAYSGSRFTAECRAAIASVRKTSSLPIALVSDVEDLRQEVDAFIPMEQPEGSYLDKVRALLRSPFEHTLFLDSDTLVTTDVRVLFALPAHIDLAACYDPLGFTPCTDTPALDLRREPVPEFNSGVIFYRRTVATERFFAAWIADMMQDRRERYPLHHAIPDQPGMRRAFLAAPDLRVAVLPQEWNFRTPYPAFVHGGIAILHGKGPLMPRLAARANRITGSRVYIKGVGFLGTWLCRKGMTLIERIRHAIA
jgi:hypothetical protein